MNNTITNEQWEEVLKALPEDIRNFKLKNDEDLVVLSYKVQIHLLKQEVLKLQSIIPSFNPSK